MTAEEFWQNLSSREPGICWLWRGAKDPRGYGRVRFGGRTQLAHRIAFALAVEPPRECVCHTCDVPACCNPDHLFDGSRAVNNLDMVAKGRHGAMTSPSYIVRGDKHPGAKLTAPEVERMRVEYATGTITQRGLAARFGVSQRTVTKIVNGWSYAADAKAAEVR